MCETSGDPKPLGTRHRAAALRARHVAKGLQGLWDDRGRGIGPGEGALTRYCSHCAAFCLLRRRPPVRQLWPVAAPTLTVRVRCLRRCRIQEVRDEGKQRAPARLDPCLRNRHARWGAAPSSSPRLQRWRNICCTPDPRRCTLRCAAQVVPLVVFAQKLMAPIPE